MWNSHVTGSTVVLFAGSGNGLSSPVLTLRSPSSSQWLPPKLGSFLPHFPFQPSHTARLWPHSHKKNRINATDSHSLFPPRLNTAAPPPPFLPLAPWHSPIHPPNPRVPGTFLPVPSPPPLLSCCQPLNTIKQPKILKSSTLSPSESCLHCLMVPHPSPSTPWPAAVLSFPLPPPFLLKFAKVDLCCLQAKHLDKEFIWFYPFTSWGSQGPEYVLPEVTQQKRTELDKGLGPLCSSRGSSHSPDSLGIFGSCGRVKDTGALPLCDIHAPLISLCPPCLPAFSFPKLLRLGSVLTGTYINSFLPGFPASCSYFLPPSHFGR